MVLQMVEVAEIRNGKFIWLPYVENASEFPLTNDATTLMSRLESARAEWPANMVRVANVEVGR